MQTSTSACAFPLIFALAACVAPIDESETEPVGIAVDALCYGSSPPAGFYPNVVRSLDGGPNGVRSDGFHVPASCQFYSMEVDASPDYAEEVFVDYEIDGPCSAMDPSEQEAFVWKRQGTPPFAFWSREIIPLWFDDVGTRCKFSGSTDVDDANYSRLIIAARGANLDGSAVAPELRAVETLGHGETRIYQLPPETCPMTLQLPTQWDSSRTLDGAPTSASYSAPVGAAACDFVSMAVDTYPDRAGRVKVGIVSEQLSTIDVDSIEIYIWLTDTVGTIRRQRMPATTGKINGKVGLIAELALGNNIYTHVHVAARAVSDDGSPVGSIELLVQE